MEGIKHGCFMKGSGKKLTPRYLRRVMKNAEHLFIRIDQDTGDRLLRRDQDRIKSFVKAMNFSVLLIRYLPFCHKSPIYCVIVGVIGIPLIPCIFLRSEE